VIITNKLNGTTSRLLALLLTVAMALPVIPVYGTPAGEPGEAAPRAITNDAKDLIVPPGESYDLFGCHTYTRSVQINGTLRISPYDGVSDTTGTLTLIAPRIIVGPGGSIAGDGRGYGGGGGGTDYYSSVTGGLGGVGGNGGNGCQYYYTSSSGGGGGGSNGGLGGTGYLPGQPGTELGGGSGGGSGYAGGQGGKGFGGGGGGGGAYYSGGGGGGGGGSGGKDATWYNGGDGGGLYGGKGPSGGTYNTGVPGIDGGYRETKTNGDTSTDLSVWRGSGGSGGATNAYYYAGGAGGGGAGGAAITLISGGEVMIGGTVLSSGAAGGVGGANYYGTGGAGGGGAGGGIVVFGVEVDISGTMDARGRSGASLSASNGGTIKLFYALELSMNEPNVQGGRIYKNGRPVMQELLSPSNDGPTILRPTFTWEAAVDPEGEPATYQIQVASSRSFSPTIIDKSGITGKSYTASVELVGAEFFWRVRARDVAGFGAWSDTWRFLTDITPPVSKVEPLPTWTPTADINVSWDGTDDSSGIGSYTIWVAMDNQTFKPWLNDTPSTSALYPGKDGHKYSFYSCGMDRALNRESPHAGPDTFTTVDLSPPVSGLVGLAPFQSTKRFTISWAGKDATSGAELYDVLYSDNNGPFSMWLQQVDRTSAEFEGKEFHEYAFYTTATDRAGNVEGGPGPERISRTKVDLTNPVTTLTLGDPNYGQSPTFITSQTAIYLAGSDTYAGLNETMYSIDDRPARTFRDRLLEPIPGSHNMTYWTVDRAGNKEPDSRLWFFVDADSPLTTLSVNGANWTASDRIYLSTQTQIVLSSFDRSSGLAAIEYNLDGRGYNTYTKPLKFDAAGFHAITYRGVDNVGNLEVERSVKIFVDLTAPVTNVLPLATVSRQAIAISLTATDADSGVANTFFRLTRGSDKPGDYVAGTEVTIEALDDHSTDGNYTLQFFSEDHVGNAERAREIKYKIDTQAVLDTGFSGEPAVSEATFVIQGKAEPGSKVTANGNTVLVAPDGTFTYQVDLSEGRNKIEFSVTDPAGNTMTKTAYVKYNPPLTGGSLFLPLLVVVLVVAVGGIVAFVYLKKRKGPGAG